MKTKESSLFPTCGRGFPKSYSSETSCDGVANYYAEYRRRSPDECGEHEIRKCRVIDENGRSTYKELMVDNSWVIPYNRTLLRRFQCHMNVEICNTRVAAIKYLFKYICKGCDMSQVSLHVNGTTYFDEIERYQEATYLSASEALWRFFEFNIVEQSRA